MESIRILYNSRSEDKIPYAEMNSGTSSETIKEMMLKAERDKLPLICFSTYNSADRIEKARLELDKKISIVVNDEAQYLVQERFYDILTVLKSTRCYFFTATTVSTPSDKGRGMNNKESYGDILYMMTPLEAINLGKMVRPRLHFVILKDQDIKYDVEDFKNSLGHIIEESFRQHQYAIRTNPKILISVEGVKDIKSFLESKEYKSLRMRGVDVFAVASDSEIGNDINGIKTSRQDFLKTLKKYGEDRSKSMIVLHYDVLAEGIDVPGFTGGIPLRHMSKSKSLQTFGRYFRLDPIDRGGIDNGKLDQL